MFVDKVRDTAGSRPNPLPTPSLDQKGLIDAYGTVKRAFSSVAAIFEAMPQIAPPGR